MRIHKYCISIFHQTFTKLRDFWDSYPPVIANDFRRLNQTLQSDEQEDLLTMVIAIFEGEEGVIWLAKASREWTRISGGECMIKDLFLISLIC